MKIKNIFCAFRFPLSYIHGKQIKIMLKHRNPLTILEFAKVIIYEVFLDTVREVFDVDLAKRL